MSRRVKIMIAVPVAVVAIVALFAAVGLVARDGASDPDASLASIDRTAGAYDGTEPVMGSDAGTAGKSLSGGGADEQAVSAAVPPASAPSAHHLLRTGDLSLLAARGTLLSTVDRVKSMTLAMDGYVMSSAIGSRPTDVGTPIEPMPLDDAVSSMDGGERAASSALEDPYASLVVRVPEQLFDTALKRFSKLGEVQSASTSSEDVTAQYVDLRARLRHYRAVERRLLGFLSETTNVNQMLAVQDRIDQVQLTIEELSAQLKSLREVTTYGTLSVFISERGHDAGRRARERHVRRHLLELDAPARPRRSRDGSRAHRIDAVHRRLRRHRPGRVVPGEADAPRPQADGAADAPGLTSSCGRPLHRARRPCPCGRGRGSLDIVGEPRPRAG